MPARARAGLTPCRDSLPRPPPHPQDDGKIRASRKAVLEADALGPSGGSSGEEGGGSDKENDAPAEGGNGKPKRRGPRP